MLVLAFVLTGKGSYAIWVVSRKVLLKSPKEGKIKVANIANKNIFSDSKYFQALDSKT